MLSQPESGLSTGDYNTLLGLIENPAYSVIAHRYTPSWSSSNLVAWPYHSNFAYDGNDTVYYLQVTNASPAQLELWKYVISTDTASQLAILGGPTGSLRANNMSLFMRPAILIDSSGKLRCFYHEITVINNFRIHMSIYNTNGTLNTADAAIITLSGTPSIIQDVLLLEADFNHFNSQYNPANATGPVYTATGTSTTTSPPSDPRNAFDGDLATAWKTTGATGILEIDLTSTSYFGDSNLGTGEMWVGYTIIAETGLAPKTWTFQGSNDNSTWTTLDTRTNITVWAGNTNTFSFSNSTRYKYYRINITESNGSTISIVSFQMLMDMYTGLATNRQPSNCFHMSATYDDTLYITRWDDTVKGFYLERWTLSGGVWSAQIPSPTFADRPIWMDAIRLSDGSDYIVVSTPTPGTNSVTTQGTSVYSYHQANTSLLAFRCPAKTSGDPINPFPVEIDSQPAVQSIMLFGRCWLSKMNGLLFLYVEKGGQGGRYSGLESGMYTSSDEGKTWSDFYSLASRADGNLISTTTKTILPKSDSSGSGHGILTDTTLLFGYSSAAAQLDLTDRIVDPISYTQDPVTQMTLNFHNEDNFFDTHAWFQGTHQVVFRVKVGYYPLAGGDPGTTPLLVPLPDVMMDTTGVTYEVPDTIFNVTGRDYIALMTDWTKSRDAKYFQSQLIGSDDYADQTGTSYGGLSHLEIEALNASPGIWTTTKGNLVYTPPTTNRVFQIAASTFQTDILTGSFQFPFTLTDNTVSQIGIVFRMLDLNNFYAMVYDVSSDTIQLWQYRNGGLTVEATSGAMSWKATITTVQKWIKVEFGFGTINGYTSTDGINWTVTVANIQEKYPISGIHTWVQRMDRAASSVLISPLEATMQYPEGGYLSRTQKASTLPRGQVGILVN